ncbi:hypothetical protein D7V91_13985 [bacterium 1xD42-67]|nr:hypothetical protein D7V91_13985 [bacterium 1xD42-67]
MGVSGIGMGNYQAQDGERLAQTLREQRASQPSLSEMMKDAREQAEQREKMFQIPKNSRRYGDAPVMAYAKLARARSVGEVDAASGYARRQMAQLRAAKRSDPENADRIQAAIDQLQKAVNRAGRKKRELSQEKLAEVRRARLEKEERTREAKRQRSELRRRRAQRMIRESGYLREAEVDDKVQSQLSAAKLALRDQMQELSDRFQPSVEDAVQQYAASAVESAPAPEISVEA